MKRLSICASAIIMVGGALVCDEYRGSWYQFEQAACTRAWFHWIPAFGEFLGVCQNNQNNPSKFFLVPTISELLGLARPNYPLHAVNEHVFMQVTFTPQSDSTSGAVLESEPPVPTVRVFRYYGADQYKQQMMGRWTNAGLCGVAAVALWAYVKSMQPLHAFIRREDTSSLGSTLGACVGFAAGLVSTVLLYKLFAEYGNSKSAWSLLTWKNTIVDDGTITREYEREINRARAVAGNRLAGGTVREEVALGRLMTQHLTHKRCMFCTVHRSDSKLFGPKMRAGYQQRATVFVLEKGGYTLEQFVQGKPWSDREKKPITIQLVAQ